MAFTRSQHERRLTDREEGYKQNFCFNFTRKGYPQATLELPSSHLGATLKPSGSQPVATPRLPRSHPEATLKPP